MKSATKNQSASLTSFKVREIHISPGHNFFGHHGKLAGTHPTISVDEVECVAGEGLRGDRFFGYKKNYQGQVTFFSAEVFQDLCEQFKVVGKSAGVLRRNVITSGFDLNQLVGAQFELQGIRFEGVAECSPCLWMNQAFGPGAEEFLKDRGGLRARILTTGTLRVEDLCRDNKLECGNEQHNSKRSA